MSGRYILGRVLGQGGFGITYVAQDHKTGELVAVKEYFPETMATRAEAGVIPFTGQLTDNYTYGRQCFLEEAETLARFIGNPGIVRVHSYFEENGTAYFAMDYISGIDLESHIKKQGGKLSWEESARILFPVMDALAAVHAQGIIHRDVTPDNIYLTSSGEVKLLDFGAARYSLGDRSRSLDIVLKHGFAPKEQYSRRGRQGAYTDVYAMAATLYYCLTGRILPDSIDRMEDGDLVLPSSLGARIPPAAEDALDKALSVQPQDRYQTMYEFKCALEQLEPSSREAPQPAAPGETYAPPSGPSGGSAYAPPVGPSGGSAYVPPVGPSGSPANVPLPAGPAVAAAAPQTKERPRWLIPGIISGAAVLVILLAVLLRSPAKPENVNGEPSISLADKDTEPSDRSDEPSGPAEKTDGIDRGSIDTSSIHSANTLQEKYAHYANKTTLFELYYPKDYTVNEYNEGNVYFSDPSGSDFRFYVEYLNTFPDGEPMGTATYGAARAGDDPSVLADWLGITTEDFELTDSGWTSIAGKDCCEFDWRLTLSDLHCEGAFLLLDTDGNYGCYLITWILNQDSKEKDTCYKHLDTLKKSFRITGAYQAEVPEPPKEPSLVLNVDPHGMDNYMANYAPGAVWAFSIMDIDDGEIVGSDAMYDQLSSSALLNIPILYACAALSDEGIISLDTTIRVERATAGRGIVQGKVGQSLPVRELLQYMLQYSDNTASNTLMSNLSFKSINETCARYGYTSVNLNNYILSTTDYTSNDNYVSCADLCGMLRELYSDRFSTIGSSFLQQNMVIKDSAARSGLGQSVPSYCWFLNHNGQKADKYNEVAIVDTGSNAYVIAFMGSRVSMEKLTAAAQTCGRYLYGTVGVQ